MIVDLEREPSPPEFPADVCIAGAGAAGIMLAAELLRQGRRVVLLESGGLALEPAAQVLNECTYAGQPHRGANTGRFRALGGTTTAWGGQVLELGEEDFAARFWIPGSGWPFSKKKLQPYYDRALNAELLAQVIRSDSEVWREMKMTAPDFGNAFEPYFTRWCPVPNFAWLSRDTFKSPNLCVVLHATATAMLHAEDSSRIVGLRCRTIRGIEQTFTAAQYVLCLGTIESVRFLLQPLPGAQTPSWNKCGLLGRHFQSHIDLNAACVPAADALRLRRWFANAYLRGYKYHPKFRLAFPVQREQGILNIAGSVTCINPDERELRRAKALARNIVQGRAPAIWADLPPAFRQLSLLLRMGYGYRVQRRAHWPKNSAFWLRVHCEQEPLSRSSITLTNARDATGLLQAQLDWHVSSLEWKTIRYFTEQVKRTFAAQNLAHILPQPELALEDGFRNIIFDDSHHHMGGARMAANSAEGIVDPDLRLYGLDNAYVCSASVFPASGFSNPTHTLIALAIRLADHLTTPHKNSFSSRPERSGVEEPAFLNRAPDSSPSHRERWDQPAKDNLHA